jgi:hypothetical protein
MNVTQVEPLFPMPMSMDTKRELFKFTKSDFFPPHLDLFANQPWNAKEKDPNQRSNIKESSIFSWYQLLRLASIMKGTVPWDFKLRSQTPDQGKTIKEVEEYNRNELKRWFKVDVFSRRNVGELKDWYSDARFSQQHFTGTNPTTIETASLFWTDHFILAAKAKDDAAAKDIITELSSSSHESLYIQDYSYFRRSAGLTPAADIQCENQSKKGSYRYGCASVCLFYLNPKGQLYPLAIVIDWRGSLERSVTIYNRELFKRTDIQSGNPKYNPKEEMLDEADDWPWRYGESPPSVTSGAFVLTLRSLYSQDLCSS